MIQTLKQFHSENENQTADIAAAIARTLKPGAVVAFTGGLGAGKTAFVRGALAALGNTSHVSSPTFALVHDYGGTPNIFHFDMYRVTDWDSLYSTGYFDYLDGENILFIEWSENITSALPDGTIFIDIAHGEKENERIITVTGGGF